MDTVASQMAATVSDAMTPGITKDLDLLLRKIHFAYISDTVQKSRDVVAFTINTLEGEYKNLKSGDELRDVFDKMKQQGQIGPSNTEFIEFYAKNTNKEDRKALMEEVHAFKKKYRYIDNKNLVGRYEDMEKIRSSIEKANNRVVNIFGEKGVGKTTLAHEIANQLVKKPVEQVLFVDLQYALDVVTIIRSILLEFKDPKSIYSPSKELVYKAVENLEKRSILVLDSLSLSENKDFQNEQMKFLWFLREIIEHDKDINLVILVTSHSELPGNFVKNHKLDALTKTNSAELLKDVDADDRTVDEISHLCENRPLYLQATTAILRERLTQPQKVLDICRSESKHDINNVLTQVFDVFSLDLKRAAIQLSLFQSPFTLKLATLVLKCSSSKALFYLGSLRNRHFLSQLNKRYSMHSLVKEVLTNKAKNKNFIDIYNHARETFSQVFLKRATEIARQSDKDYVKVYLQIQKEKYDIDFALKISFERGFLVTSSYFGDNFCISIIAKCLQPGHERAKLFRDLSEAALMKGELISYIHLSSYLILVLLEKTSTKPEARDRLKQVGEVLAKIEKDPTHPEESFQLAKSSYQFALGEIAYADFHNKISTRKQFDEGLICHKECLQTRLEFIGDHTETTRSLNAIGNCFMEIQEYETALRYYTKAVEMRKRLSGDKEHVDSPIYMNQIAVVHEEKGKKLKNKSRESEMPAKKQLFEEAESEFQQAVDKYKEALNIERRLHLYGNAGTATFCRNLSNAYSYLEQYQKSYVYAKKALAIRKRILGIDVNTVRSYYQIGVSYEWLGKEEKALKYYYKAYNMENKLPPGERSRVKVKIEGKIVSLLGDIQEAIEFDRRTDDEALTSGDDDDDERPKKEEQIHSEDSSTDIDSSEDDTLAYWESSADMAKTDCQGMNINELAKEPFQSLEASDDRMEVAVGKEVDGIHQSRVIGSDGCTWEVGKSGVVICFDPNTLQSETLVTCHLEHKFSDLLDPSETLVSRIIKLTEKLSAKKSFNLVIPHSGPAKTQGYEVVVKDYCEESETWKDVNADMFINIQNGADMSKQGVGACVKIVKFPSILLTRESHGGMICVVSRLVTDTISIESSKCTLTSSVFPNICVELPEDAFKGFTTLSLKVHPAPSSFYKSNLLCFGPVLELLMLNSLSGDILKPVTVTFPHPLAFHGSECMTDGLRLLYKERNDEGVEWIDITDDIVFDIHGNVVTTEIKHFSWFWPVWIKDSNATPKALEIVTSLFCKIFGKSPVMASFAASEKPESRVGDITVLEVRVMPWHLAPGQISNSLVDLYDQQKIIIDFDGVKRHNEKSCKEPFLIKFDIRCIKQSDMHVDVQEQAGTCQFKGFESSDVFCEVHITFHNVKEISPKDFFGIPLDHKYLQDTAIQNVLAECCAILDKIEDPAKRDELLGILEETRSKNTDSKAIEHFYHQVAHKDYEGQIFCAISEAHKASSDHGTGGIHVKGLLEKGRNMVQQPIDRETINLISSNMRGNCESIASALSLTEEFEEISKKFQTTQEQFYELMKTWKGSCDKPPNLHCLMKVLRKARCQAGMDQLMQRYKELLSEKVSPEQETRESVLASPEVLVCSETENRSASANIVGELEGFSCTRRKLESTNKAENHSVMEKEITSEDWYGSSLVLCYGLCLIVVASSLLVYRYTRK